MSKQAQSIMRIIRRRGLSRAVVAIDGRCASGKSTAARFLQDMYGFTVIHADDFFLRPHQRTEERLCVPGGNIDYERLRDEVLIPLRSGAEFSYLPFCCRTSALLEPVTVSPGRLFVIEGSYSAHPELWEYCDLHFFMTTSRESQLSRLKKRTDEHGLRTFIEKWIPLEEEYFSAYNIEERCDAVLST